MQNQELLALMRDFLSKAAELSERDFLSKAAELSELVQKEIDSQSKPLVSAEPVPVPVPVETNSSFKIDRSLFPSDKHVLLELLDGSDWPEAAPQFLICEDSENDKLERAEGILDYIDDKLEGKKVLDFGCGEGHVALKASETADFVVGYDIVRPTHSGNDKCLLTDDFSKVVEKGPFNLVILYDVLDHCKDPVAALNQVKSVIGPDTKVFVRCHSWMSRHGAHLYKQLNKAWVHLIFTEEELAKMGVKTEFVQKYYFPINTQNQWFTAGGLNVVSSDVIKCVVEPFFRKPELSAILAKNFDGVFPEWQMSQVFNDYVLGI